MKIIRLILLLVAAVLAVAFAISNRAPVTIDLHPLPFALEMPVFLPVLGSLAAGVLLGGFYYWISAGRWKWRARSDERKIETLERKLADGGDAKSSPGSPPAPLTGGTALPHPARQPARVRAAISDD